jgi:hypothetical protein
MRLRELKSQAFPQAGRVDSEEALMELQSRLELGSNDETTFDVVGIDGKRLRLADCRGKALIVVCAVKTSELSQMQVLDATQLRDQYASKGLEVFSFFREPEPDPSAPDEALESVKNYMRSFDVRLPAALLDDRTAQSMRLTAYPSTLFFGADGKCYFKANGYFGYPNFRLMAEALLKGPAPLPKRG